MTLLKPLVVVTNVLIQTKPKAKKKNSVYTKATERNLSNAAILVPLQCHIYLFPEPLQTCINVCALCTELIKKI